MRLSEGRGYYADTTILLTGATGLVGKALIEAIVRTLPEVRRLYVLVRPRRDATGRMVSAQDRFRDEIVATPVFDALRARYGDRLEALVRDKVEPVEGDLSRERVGLAPETYRRLQDEVDVVIGNGALAVFDAPLDEALHANALAPMRLLEFARGASKRPFVAHVSTCYVGNVAGPVFEAPLAPDWTPRGPDADDPYDVDAEVARLSDHVAALRDGGPEAARRLVSDGMAWARRRGWNDTYTFTKAMGEQLFARHRGDVPGLILRPSVIESALSTPAPGWIDGYRMMDPLIVGFARGQLTEFPGNPETVLDVVPVDTVVNALLMAIPFTHAGEGAGVYQVASGSENPMRVAAFASYVREHYQRAPLRRTRLRGDGEMPQLTFPEPATFRRHLEVGYLLPIRALEAVNRPLAATTAWGRRRQSVLRSRRARVTWLRDLAEIYGPYAESRTRFLSHEVRRLWRSLGEEDRATYPFDVRELEWKRYVQDVHLPGIERYLLGSPGRRAAGGPDAAESNAEQAPRPARSQSASPTGGRAPALLAPAEERASRSSLRHAERVLALTRSVGADEARVWTAPTYKRLIRRASLQAIRWVARLRLELSWSGREHLPERGPFIVVANHTSHVDTGVLLAALGGHATSTHPTAAADYWFRRPAVAWAMHATMGGIPFDRRRRNVARALALPAQVLRNGRSLIFYPEGTRSPDGTLQPFRSTVGLLALAAAVPIVPAHVVGAAQALPKGRAMIIHRPVHVRFGAPIAVEPFLAGLDRESVASASRRLAREAHDAVARLAPGSAVPAEEGGS